MTYREITENLKPRYYDKKGKQIPLLEWADLYENLDYRTIKQNTYGDFFVSTVWLGLDQNVFSIEGFPVIFETMIFVKGNEKHELHHYQERYIIEEEAIKGHEEACVLIKLAQKYPESFARQMKKKNKEKINE